jgi:hypothetical protein
MIVASVVMEPVGYCMKGWTLLLDVHCAYYLNAHAKAKLAVLVAPIPIGVEITTSFYTSPPQLK